jgi:inositol oxygenase
MLRSIKPMEWMQKMSTWILDLPIPQGIENPELNAYNADHVELSSSKDSNVLLTLQYGMENMTLPWTTDEYLYRVLEFNKNTLPVEALQVIRYWSLKLWHETNHYENICAPQDFETKEWLHAVENCRKMSSKQIESVSVDRLMPYYMGLTEKYLPSTLQW